MSFKVELRFQETEEEDIDDDCRSKGPKSRRHR